MEVKARYQYTYFIYPYMVKQNKYIKYLMKLQANKNISLKIFQKDKDYDVYRYFLPKVRNYMFSGFNFDKEKVNHLKEISQDTRAALLAKENCIVFDYNVEKDIHGKTGEDGIFFKIQNIQIICFNTGICFLCIKTNVEDLEEFSNILNFNYKFKDIYEEYNNLNNYDHIKVQTDAFDNMKSFKQFIQDVTETEYNESKLNIDTQKFLTYSYTCIDQDNWNDERTFEDLKSTFEKYVGILPQDSSIDYNNKDLKIISKWKYAKIGITKQGITMFCSTADMNNYTRLPLEFETNYLYTYIFTLYKKIYLQIISENFKEENFINYTKKIWIHEVTSDDCGTAIYNEIQEVIELDKLYSEIKNKYDVLYKGKNIEKDKKIDIFIAVLLIASLAFNVLNFVTLSIK